MRATWIGVVKTLRVRCGEMKGGKFEPTRDEWAQFGWAYTLAATSDCVTAGVGM